MILFHLPDDERLLAAVGKVAVRHGQLDYVLRMTVKSLANLGVREALDATERQGSRELRERIRKLANQRLGEGQPLVLLDGLLARARRASARQNQLLHGLWAAHLDGEAVLRHDDKNWNALPTAAELDAVAVDLNEIATAINFARLDGFLKEALDRRCAAD
jgi:hypothetical protein